jgi:hypothetical protein
LVAKSAPSTTDLAVDLSGDIHVTELSFNLESVRARSRVLILTGGHGRALLLLRGVAAA